MIAAHDARPLRRLAVAYLCISVAFAIGASIVGLRDHMDVLFADDWRVLDRYQSQTLLPFLLGSENGHRLPVTLALFAIDHEWFEGRMRTLVVASIACTALATGVLWRVFRRQDGLGSALSCSVLGFACFSFFWAVSCNEFHWGLCQMIIQAAALVVAALGALAAVDPTRIRASRGSLGLAVLGALLATLSHGVGAASWAALVAVAAVRRFPRRIVGCLAATGAAVIALYGATLPPHPKISFQDSLDVAVQSPAALAGSALAFVGSAPARVVVGLGVGEPVPKLPRRGLWAAHTSQLYWISLAIGALGFLLFALVAVRRWRRPVPGAAVDSLVIGLMAFSIAGGLLVAFARAAISGPAAVVQLRFVTWSTLFWIGAVCALLPRTPERVAGPIASLAVLVLPIVSLAMLPALRDAREFNATTASQASRLSLSLLLGLRHDDLARSVALDDADLVYRVASRLESDRRRPFQGPRYGVRGAPLDQRFAPTNPCAGGVDRVRAIGAVAAAEVSGWVAHRIERQVPRFVVLTDEGGVIRGLADSASVPPRYAAGLRPNRLAWTGFIADYDPGQRYTPYAVLDDGDTACLLRAP